MSIEGREFGSSKEARGLPSIEGLGALSSIEGRGLASSIEDLLRSTVTVWNSISAAASLLPAICRIPGRSRNQSRKAAHMETVGSMRSMRSVIDECKIRHRMNVMKVNSRLEYPSRNYSEPEQH